MKNLKKQKLRDKIFIEITEIISKLSNCKTRNVGAILVRDNMILSTGYNGTPKKIIDCNKGGCKRCNEKNKSGDLQNCICIHAEMNCILQAALNGINTKNSIIYCTNKPCNDCIKNCINAGILKIYYKNEYPTILNKQLLKNIKVIKWT